MSQPTAADDTTRAMTRAVVVTHPGDLDAPEIKDVPVPEPHLICAATQISSHAAELSRNKSWARSGSRSVDS
ncbi:hypothetical protein [Streptomyces sp. NPDC060322]|uniref:hypothetical protein n=1 Tax=Streptomyces sp. NPDC060322 TaxID=3347097 RepID=UPI003652FE6E